MSFSARHFAAAAALCTTALLGSGCDLLEAFDNSGTTLVQMMVTHHATPEDGIFPDRSNGDARTFETDDGWTVSLRAAFVTTSHATLHECNGGDVEFDTFWGQLPENINNTDLELLSFAAGELDPNSPRAGGAAAPARWRQHHAGTGIDGPRGGHGPGGGSGGRSRRLPGQAF